MAKPITYLTREEWHQRIAAAAEMASELLPAFVESTKQPGPGVLAALMLARAICMANPGLPDFGWYCRRVEELPGPDGPERDV